MGGDGCCPKKGADTGDCTRKDVQEYYGKILNKTDDLQSNACCTSARPPPRLAPLMSRVHDEVQSKYYGCGLVVPECLDDMDVLDLGSGSGRDCYIVAQLVGAKGSVCGLDMTPEQLEVANKHRAYHAELFGFSNVTFTEGFIEDLATAGITDKSKDVIISNCVVNLSPNKKAVLSEAYRVLRQGGEMYFSDVYANRRVPQSLVEHKVLFGECISGALYWQDFVELAKSVGFSEPTVVSAFPITVDNPEIEQLVKGYSFVSVTYRLFKADGGIESNEENYGQAAKYLGTIAEAPTELVFDANTKFPTGTSVKVSGNMATILSTSRFRGHFELTGDRSSHEGPFPSTHSRNPFDYVKSSSSSGGGCCAPKADTAASSGGCCPPKPTPAPASAAGGCCGKKAEPAPQSTGGCGGKKSCC